MDSAWLDRKITIDGKADDWQEGHLYDDADISSRIGIYNDDNDLYVCLMVGNRGIERQIFEQGITLWVSKSGESSKVWGLRCLMETDRPEEMRHQRDTAVEGGSGKAGSRSGHERNRWQRSENRNLFISTKRFELLTSEKGAGQIMSTDSFSRFGIQAAVSRDDEGEFVYEIKIPLDKTGEDPYAARQSKKPRVVLGFFSPKSSKSATRDSGGKGRFGSGTGNGVDMIHMFNGDMGSGYRRQGGMGGGDMGSGMGRRGSWRSGARNHQAKALDFWSVIELAAKPT